MGRQGSMQFVKKENFMDLRCPATTECSEPIFFFVNSKVVCQPFSFKGTFKRLLATSEERPSVPFEPGMRP